jgi:hypothetical protein
LNAGSKRLARIQINLTPIAPGEVSKTPIGFSNKQPGFQKTAISSFAKTRAEIDVGKAQQPKFASFILTDLPLSRRMTSQAK